jgi:hypothetical protein
MREGKKDPDLQGKLNIDGTEHWLSAWFFTYEKEGVKKRGINISIGDVIEAKTGSKPEAKKPGKFDDMEDDVPF